MLKNLLCSMICLFLCWTDAAVSQSASTKQVKIGLILPLTGSAASWGQAMQHAADLAMQDLDPSIRSKLTLSIEDDQLNASAAVSAFNRLVDIDHIDTGIIFGGQSVAAIVPLAEKKHIPVFAITANPRLTRGNAYAFRHWLDAAEQVRILVPELARRGIKRVALVVVTHDAMLDYASKFEQAALAQGITVVFRADFLPKDTDFRTAIQKLKNTKPDCVLESLLPPQYSAFMRQLKEAHIQMPAFGFSNTETASEVVAAEGAMEGMIYTGPKLQASFLKRFQEQYHEFPELSAGNVYDMIQMISLSVKEGASDSESIAAKLRALKDFEGVLGRYGVNADNEFLPQVEIKVVQGGEFHGLN